MRSDQALQRRKERAAGTNDRRRLRRPSPAQRRPTRLPTRENTMLTPPRSNPSARCPCAQHKRTLIHHRYMLPWNTSEVFSCQGWPRVVIGDRTVCDSSLLVLLACMDRANLVAGSPPVRHEPLLQRNTLTLISPGVLRRVCVHVCVCVVLAVVCVVCGVVCVCVSEFSVSRVRFTCWWTVLGLMDVC